MRRIVAFSLTLAALTSGCLATGLDVPAIPDPLTVGPLPSSMEYVCPPGPNATRNGVCLSRIVSRTESDVEPYLAIHPSDPRVMAIGTNAKHTVDSVALVGSEVQVRQGQMNFFFTQDGGATWRKTVLPHVTVPGMNPTPVQIGFAGDPALEFAPDGTLHVSALMVSAVRGTTGGTGLIDVVYTSTKDLGRSWSKPVVFTRDGQNDRNWITLGPSRDIYIPWQKPGATVDVAWSLDAGASWKQLSAEQRPRSCATASIVIALEEGPVFACAGMGGGRLTGLRVQRLDVGTGAVTELANVTDMPCVWPQLERVADGGLILIGEACRDGERNVPGLRLSRSDDGGKTWSAPVKITPDTKARVDITMWLRADPWGGLHLLATRQYTDLEHVLLDPKDFRIVWSQIVRPAEPQTTPPRIPEGFPSISGGDHYYGLVFTKTDGYAAWARDYGLDFARLRPLFGSDASAASKA